MVRLLAVVISTFNATGVSRRADGDWARRSLESVEGKKQTSWGPWKGLSLLLGTSVLFSSGIVGCWADCHGPKLGGVHYVRGTNASAIPPTLT